MPFAVISYKTFLKGGIKESSGSDYEVLYLDGGELHRYKADRAQVAEALPKMERVLHNSNGSVWEHGDFKNKALALHGRGGLRQQLKF